MGNDCWHICSHYIVLNEEQTKDPEVILDVLGDYFKPAKNVIYESYTFGCCKAGRGRVYRAYIFLTRLRE